MKLSLADGPYIPMREGNLSEEFQRTLEIDCVLAIQRTDVCLQITGKTEEPMFSNAEIVRAVITCFRFRIANNTTSAGAMTELSEKKLISQPHA